MTPRIPDIGAPPAPAERPPVRPEADSEEQQRLREAAAAGQAAVRRRTLTPDDPGTSAFEPAEAGLSELASFKPVDRPVINNRWAPAGADETVIGAGFEPNVTPESAVAPSKQPTRNPFASRRTESPVALTTAPSAEPSTVGGLPPQVAEIINNVPVKPVIGLTAEERRTARANILAGVETAGANTRVGKRTESVRKATAAAESETSDAASLRAPERGRVSKVDQLIESSIGVDRTNRNPAELARLRRAKEANRVLKVFAEKGVAGLTNVMDRKLVVSRVREIYGQLPQVEAAWKGKTDAEIQAIILEKMKDPRFVAQFKDAYAEATAEDVVVKIDVAAASKKLLELKNKRDETTEAITINGTKRAQVDARLREFQISDTGVKGAKLQELDNLIREMPTLTAQRGEKSTQLERAQALLYRLEAQRAIINPDGKKAERLSGPLKAAEDNVSRLTGELRVIDGKIQRKADLEGERQGLETAKEKLDDQWASFERKKTEVEHDFAVANANEASSTESRTAAEDEFVGNLENVFSLAAYRHMVEVIDTLETADKAIQTREIADAHDRADKAVLLGIAQLYGRGKPEFRKGRFFRKDKTVPGRFNETAIEEGYDMLVHQNRPDLLLRTIVKSAIDPETGKLMLSNEELEAKMADREYVARMVPKAVEAILKARSKTDGITEADALRIAKTKEGAALLLKKISGDTEVKQRLETVKKTLELKTDQEALAAMGGKSLLALLLAIVGAVGMVAINNAKQEQ